MENHPEPTEWVELYGDALYSYAYYKTSDREQANDAIQETFLRGIRKLEGFENRSHIKTWLTGILKNVLHESNRRKNLENLTASSAREENNTLDLSDLKALAPDIAIERSEFWQAVDVCLAKMPPQMAKIFSDKEIEGRSTSEISSELEVTPNSVWVTLHRARLFLRKCLVLLGVCKNQDPS